MQIVTYSHPALLWKSKPVTAINSAVRKNIEQMFELMYAHKGVGLAANQVSLPFRYFVMNPTGDPAETDQQFVFINPEITYRKGSVEGEEGCLSFPELYGPVRRAEQITVQAFDLNGDEFQMQLNDYPARIVLHETDHLDGVLFIDRMTDANRKEREPQIVEIEAYFRRQQQKEEFPSDDAIREQLKQMEQEQV